MPYTPSIRRRSSCVCLCFPGPSSGNEKAPWNLHTLLDLRGNIPSVVIITPGSVHDVNIIDELIIEARAIYIMDRGYLDFTRLHQFGVFFVTRAKVNLSRR